MAKKKADNTVFRGERAKLMREKAGYTQTEVAAIIKSSQSTVYQYEDNQREPMPTVVEQMARLYGCSADYLLGLVDSPGAHLRLSDLDDQERQIIDALRARKLFLALKLLIKFSEGEP